MGKLNSGIPQVPPSGLNLHSESTAVRQDLPIWPQRQEIIQAISQNQVVLITGETGSGKTTQVIEMLQILVAST